MTSKHSPFLNLPSNHDDFAIGRWTGITEDGLATGIIYPPRRVQRKRTKGWKMPGNTVYVGRGSVWGNPFKEGEHWRHGALRISTGNVAFNTQLLKAFGDRKMTRDDCVTAYRIYLDYAGIPSREGRWPEPKDLRGKNLACWCGEGVCHADVLLERANA
jgi:hypothetical protein